jgi:hypothetical protein
MASGSSALPARRRWSASRVGGSGSAPTMSNVVAGVMGSASISLDLSRTVRGRFRRVRSVDGAGYASVKGAALAVWLLLPKGPPGQRSVRHGTLRRFSTGSPRGPEASSCRRARWSRRSITMTSSEALLTHGIDGLNAPRPSPIRGHARPNVSIQPYSGGMFIGTCRLASNR